VQPEGGVSVSAVMHRPLRGAKPWSFDFRGICPGAYEETKGNCMAHQLGAVLQRTLPLETALTMRGGSELEYHFDQIFEELYPLELEYNPYVSDAERRSWREVGVTCAMILVFSRMLCISVHILWGETKVLSHTHEASATVCSCTFTGIMFFSDPHTKATIAKMKNTKPGLRPDEVPKVLHKNGAPPAAEWHEWDSSAPIRPGHFVVDDLLRTRLELHGQSLCTKVYLNGKGIPRALWVHQKEGDVVIHKRAPEAFICEAFAAVLQRRTKRDLVYCSESLASCRNHAFVRLLKPPPARKRLTAN
jgi:hypothetical protein